MAAVSELFDVKIRVVFPFLTKSLPQDDNERINATGAFNFEPPPQVETPVNIGGTLIKEINSSDRVKNLKSGLENLVFDFDNIQEVFKKRAGHIILRYDPELAENEALSSAEIEIFGSASGEITYEKFDQILDYQDKINKYISHMSIENNGVLSGVA